MNAGIISIMDLEKLQTIIGYTFRDPTLLELALTHPSCAHERVQTGPNNERLEFLGDAVLGLAVSQHLYRLHPDLQEGHLTKMRAHLASRSALRVLAERLGLGGFLRLGTAEEHQGGRRRASNLSNALEAMIGAIFLDGGFSPACDFVVCLISPQLEDLLHNPEPENAKGLLQEKMHMAGKMVVYRLVRESGPDHRKQFDAVVEIDGQPMGNGSGHTKKEAEMRAAAMALEELD
ncbi:MAG: ribonuclease III [Verrucomicrobiae bacterium]|nr:ribonuclease III [Verrucomicrobiae bacterium]